MARFGRDDWLRLGLAALADGGEPGLRLEAITGRAGKTRGSFYHHFETHDDFIAALVSAWKTQNTDALIAEAEGEDTAVASARKLNALAAGLDHRLDRAVRRLSARHPAAAEAVATVDAARIAYLRQLQADPASEASADYALIEYAVFVGIQTILPDSQPARLEALGRLTTDMIAVHWNE